MGGAAAARHQPAVASGMSLNSVTVRASGLVSTTPVGRLVPIVTETETET